MHSREQTRRAAILPIKIHVDLDSGKQVLLAHTTNISRAGCRAVAVQPIAEDSEVLVEFKHHRSYFKVTWCRRAPGLKYQVHIGMKKLKPDPRFWGEELPHGKPEMGNYTLSRRSKNLDEGLGDRWI